MLASTSGSSPLQIAAKPLQRTTWLLLTT